jgi:hypothetical protein
MSVTVKSQFICEYRLGCPRKLSANRDTLFANGESRPVVALRMGNSVYTIDAFSDDDRLWRIEWIGGGGYIGECKS